MCPKWVPTECHFTIRPPDIVVGGLRPMFYHGFFLLSFLFAVWSRSSLNGTQRKSATWSKVSAIWKRMSKIWGIPCPYKSGTQKLPFWTTSQINGNFNGLYLRNETRYRQSVQCVSNYGESFTSPKMSWTLIHKRLKSRPAFYPPSVNSAFCFIARLRRRRSANGTQSNFDGKSC